MLSLINLCGIFLCSSSFYFIDSVRSISPYGAFQEGYNEEGERVSLILVCKLIERLSVYRTPTNSVETVSGAWYQLLRWLLKFRGTVLEVHGCHVCLVLASCQKKTLFSVITSTCQWQQLSFSCSKFIIIRTKSNSEWADERKPARWKTKLGTLLRGKNWRKLSCE